jgi:hypothetical protein
MIHRRQLPLGAARVKEARISPRDAEGLVAGSSHWPRRERQTLATVLPRRHPVAFVTPWLADVPYVFVQLVPHMAGS